LEVFVIAELISKMSLVRQNYHQDCEIGVNKQINLELYASYVYASMASHFERDDIALYGFAKFFRKSSDEENEHARLLMEFQNKRGGRVVLQNIMKPEKDEWGTSLDAIQAALALEKQVNVALLDLHKVAITHNDNHMTNFLENHYLNEQVESIKQLADHVTNLKRVGPGLGEFMYDKKMMEEK